MVLLYRSVNVNIVLKNYIDSVNQGALHLPDELVKLNALGCDKPPCARWWVKFESK